MGITTVLIVLDCALLIVVATALKRHDDPHTIEMLRRQLDRAEGRQPTDLPDPFSMQARFKRAKESLYAGGLVAALIYAGALLAGHLGIDLSSSAEW